MPKERRRFDFVHPKQPPPPPRYGRKIALYAAAAAIALALVTGHFKSRLDEAVDDARSLASDVKKTEDELKRWRSRTAVVDAIGRWRAGEIHWLEELRYLSEQFPAADQAVVRRITMAPTNTGNGVMSMSVRVADPGTLDKLEANLRDNFHQVSSKRISQSEGQQNFPFQFETSIFVQPHPVETTPDSEAAADPLLATQR